MPQYARMCSQIHGWECHAKFAPPPPIIRPPCGTKTVTEMVPPLLNHQHQHRLTVRFVVYLHPDVFPKLGRIFNSGFDEQATLLIGWVHLFDLRRFRSMSGQFCSMNRRFQLTCLHCTLKMHHNNKYWETKETLSLWRNHYSSHFLPFLAQQNHFSRDVYAMIGAYEHACMPSNIIIAATLGDCHIQTGELTLICVSNILNNHKFYVMLHSMGCISNCQFYCSV